MRSINWSKITLKSFFKTFKPRIGGELENVLQRTNLCSARGKLWARASNCRLWPSTVVRGSFTWAPRHSQHDSGSMGLPTGTPELGHATSAEIWQQHRHLWDYISKVNSQWTGTAKCSQKSQPKNLGPFLSEKHPFRSGEFCFSTMGCVKSNVPSYSCFNILNYGLITNVSTLHWI